MKMSVNHHKTSQLSSSLLDCLIRVSRTVLGSVTTTFEPPGGADLLMQPR